MIIIIVLFIYTFKTKYLYIYHNIAWILKKSRTCRYSSYPIKIQKEVKEFLCNTKFVWDICIKKILFYVPLLLMWLGFVHFFILNCGNFCTLCILRSLIFSFLSRLCISFFISLHFYSNRMPMVMDTYRDPEIDETSIENISRAKLTNTKMIMKTFVTGALKEKEQVNIAAANNSFLPSSPLHFHYIIYSVFPFWRSLFIRRNILCSNDLKYITHT